MTDKALLPISDVGFLFGFIIDVINIQTGEWEA
jgi:hypothetical protein